MCCTRITGNAGPKKWPKNRHLGTIAQLCRAISSQLRHVSTIGKKLLSSNIFSTCLTYGKLRPTSGCDRSGSLGHPQQISTAFASWLRYCSDVAQQKRTKRYTMFGRYLGWQTIYTLSAAIAPFPRYSRQWVQNRYIWLPLLCLTPPTEGFPWDDLRKIFCEYQWVAKVPNGEETFLKISTG